MKFASIGSALQWYSVTREGSPRASRFEPVTTLPRRSPAAPGGELTALCEIGRALHSLAETERAVLYFRHGRGLSLDGTRAALSRLTHKRYRRQTVSAILIDAAQVLDGELRRRGLLHDEPDTEE